jgi:hypothetical protein
MLLVCAGLSGLASIVGIGMALTLDEMPQEKIGSLVGAAVFAAICVYLIRRMRKSRHEGD